MVITYANTRYVVLILIHNNVLLVIYTFFYFSLIIHNLGLREFQQLLVLIYWGNYIPWLNYLACVLIHKTFFVQKMYTTNKLLQIIHKFERRNFNEIKKNIWCMGIIFANYVSIVFYYFSLKPFSRNLCIFKSFTFRPSNFLSFNWQP